MLDNYTIEIRESDLLKVLFFIEEETEKNIIALKMELLTMMKTYNDYSISDKLDEGDLKSLFLMSEKRHKEKLLDKIEDIKEHLYICEEIIDNILIENLEYFIDRGLIKIIPDLPLA